MSPKSTTHIFVFLTAIGLSVAVMSCSNENREVPMSHEDSVKIKKQYDEIMAQAEREAKTGFTAQLDNNSAILKHTVTEVGFLYLAVVDDGSDKSPMAKYYCRLAKEHNKSEIKAVKIVDVTTFKYGDGWAKGKELGRSFCNE